METISCYEPLHGQNWYVAYTCSHHEKHLAEQCEQRGIPTFLPLYAVQRHWKRRRAEVLLPLFPSYVFIRMALAERFRVLALPGMVSLVSFKGVPAVVPETQIEPLMKAVTLGRVEPCVYLESGTRVRVTAGPLVGLEGIVLEVKDQVKVIVSFEWMTRSVSIAVDAVDLKALR